MMEPGICSDPAEHPKGEINGDLPAELCPAA